MTRSVDDRLVLLNSESGRYFTLDAIGRRVWLSLTSEPSIQSAYDRLQAEFAVEPEHLRTDLIQLIERLQAQGLIEVHRV